MITGIINYRNACDTSPPVGPNNPVQLFEI
jgi:hypothetical protein